MYLEWESCGFVSDITGHHVTLDGQNTVLQVGHSENELIDFNTTGPSSCPSASQVSLKAKLNVMKAIYIHFIIGIKFH